MEYRGLEGGPMMLICHKVEKSGLCDAKMFTSAGYADESGLREPFLVFLVGI